MFLHFWSVLHVIVCSFFHLSLALQSNNRSSFFSPTRSWKAVWGKTRYAWVVLGVLSAYAVHHWLYSALQVDSYDVTVEEDLGEIQLIKIEKRKYWYQDDWYLKYITVKTPVGDYLEFPCYRWITDEKEVVLRDGRGESYQKPDFLQNTWNSSISPSHFSTYLPVFSLRWRSSASPLLHPREWLSLLGMLSEQPVGHWQLGWMFWEAHTRKSPNAALLRWSWIWRLTLMPNFLLLHIPIAGSPFHLRIRISVPSLFHSKLLSGSWLIACKLSCFHENERKPQSCSAGANWNSKLLFIHSLCMLSSPGQGRVMDLTAPSSGDQLRKVFLSVSDTCLPWPGFGQTFVTDVCLFLSLVPAVGWLL